MGRNLWGEIYGEKILALFLPKSLTSVAEVRLFIALYEKNHLCQGKTIELISILCHCFFNILNMHGVDTVIVQYEL